MVVEFACWVAYKDLVMRYAKILLILWALLLEMVIRNVTLLHEMKCNEEFKLANLEAYCEKSSQAAYEASTGNIIKLRYDRF